MRAPETFAVTMRRDPATIPLAEKLAHVREVQRRAAALDQRIVQAQVNYSDRTTESVYIGRGLQLEQRLPRTILQVLLVASDGNEARFNFAQHGGVAGFEIAEIGDEELSATAEVAIRLLEAEHIEPGEYDTISIQASPASSRMSHSAMASSWTSSPRDAPARRNISTARRGAQSADVR